ncbi:DUF2637 domain-containing protein [Streptomyces erythrochromogenes]|uniref:DUF2637 domain-containing protein n=1 Tax=Streptomyces erythrochromogenes TaxID=285574 RepID=UPI003433A921
MRWLLAVVILGTLIIATIGFAGSYAAVRKLAEEKGFGAFAIWFPIGIDAGIVALLALDLFLAWLRLPFPLLRQTAWVLTAATIAFNGAAAWPDPLSVAMHAVIPILFVVVVEAARHAVGRIADLIAENHMDSVRTSRWVLSPVPTFMMWRRMKLWELRSYKQAVALEKARLVYRRRVEARYGSIKQAPVEVSLPLELARYTEPLPPAPLTSAEEAAAAERKRLASEAREDRRARKEAKREARRREEEAAAAATAKAEAAEREAAREAREADLAAVREAREAEREAGERELARIVAESEARVREAREAARIKAEEETRRAEREAQQRAREEEEAQFKRHEDAEREPSRQAGHKPRDLARERPPAYVSASLANPVAGARGSVADDEPMTRTERREQRREAEHEAARLLVEGSQIPTAEAFGSLFGHSETWGGDRLRAARRRLAEDAGYRDQVETELLEAAYASDTNAAASAHPA